MFGFGFSEIFLVFLIILILFGAKKIPQLGSGLGEGIKNFTQSFKGSDSSDSEDGKKEEIEGGAAKQESPSTAEKASSTPK